MSTAEDTLLSFPGSQSFGGPRSVTVVTDLGATGKRGSYFFLSDGDPNESTEENKIIWSTFLDPENLTEKLLIPSSKFALEIQRNDICINIKSGDAGYLKLYHYGDGENGTRWYEILSAAPSGVSSVFSIPFVSGQTILTLSNLEAPAAVGAVVATYSTHPTFVLSTFLMDLSVAVESLLNFQINLGHSNPTSSTIYPNPTYPNPISLFYDTSSTISYSGVLSDNPATPNLVLLSSGNTQQISIGDKITKNSGSAIFGTDAIVTNILSNTSFELSKNHQTTGELVFETNSLKANFYYLIEALDYQSSTGWADLQGLIRMHVLIGIKADASVFEGLES